MNQEQAIKFALEGHNVFLTGRAGTGKTYTLNKIIEALQENGKSVAKTASTGIAATHINGTTIHSWAGIGIKEVLTKEELFAIKGNPKSYARIKGPDVLIIDEISMLHDYRLDLVNEVLMLVRNSYEIFGGMQVIVCGDFFQLLPVENSGKKHYAFQSPTWEAADFKVCYLEKIYRQENDMGFVDILNNVRYDKITAKDEAILDSLKHNKDFEPFGINLYCTNKDVDMENAGFLNKIKTESKCFEAILKGPEFELAKMMKGWLGKEYLELKIGAKVMCIANDFKAGFCNGTLGEVIGFNKDEGGCPTIRTFKDKKVITILPYTWKVEEDDPKEITGKKVLASITQIPLRLAWALTVHKSQGCTFEYANIDLRDVRSYNQGYVALSRVPSMEGLYLKGYNWLSLRVDPFIINKDKEFQEKSKECEILS